MLTLDLFGGLQNAGSFFENSFWRRIAERLAKRDPSSYENLFATIRNKLSKQKAILSNIVAGKEGHLNVSHGMC